MKLLLIADQLAHFGAGTEGQMLQLCRGLLSRGWQVELAVLRDSEAVRSQWPTPVRVIGIQSLSSPAAWWRAWRFARRARREGFGLAHIFFNDASIILPPMLAMAGIRVLVSRRDMGIWYTPGILRALRLVRGFVDRVIANSQAVAAHTARHEGYRREQVQVIYNGVEDLPPPAPEADPPVIGLVANIRPVKRISDALEAFARITERHPEVVLEIVGAGERGALRALAESLEISERVRFTGPQEDIRSRLGRYAICLLTSESEGLSNAIIEYMLAARAVIASDTGGNPELVSDGITGLLYPVGDVTTLARHIDTLLCEPALRAQLGAAGRERILTLCAPELFLQQHEQAYHALAGRAA